MYIISRDKKLIMEAKNLQVTANLCGKKNEKYSIVASGYGLGAEIVGTYPDEKTAIDEMEKIFAAMAAGEATYEIK